MNTAQAFLFSILFLSVSSDICDAPGECVESIYLTTEPAIDSFDCWKKCRSHQNCYFGTFIPDRTQCSLFQTCTRLETTSCSNCVTSAIDCPQCDFPGLCTVSSYQRSFNRFNTCLILIKIAELPNVQYFLPN